MLAISLNPTEKWIKALKTIFNMDLLSLGSSAHTSLRRIPNPPNPFDKQGLAKIPSQIATDSPFRLIPPMIDLSRNALVRNMVYT